MKCILRRSDWNLKYFIHFNCFNRVVCRSRRKPKIYRTWINLSRFLFPLWLGIEADVCRFRIFSEQTAHICVYPSRKLFRDLNSGQTLLSVLFSCLKWVRHGECVPKKKPNCQPLRLSRRILENDCFNWFLSRLAGFCDLQKKKFKPNLVH